MLLRRKNSTYIYSHKKIIVDPLQHSPGLSPLSCRMCQRLKEKMATNSSRTCACGKKGKSSPGNNKKIELQPPTCACGKRKKQSKKENQNGMGDIGIERNNTLYIEEIGA